jgi:putative FmdB family regulatory protein
MPLFEYRCRQCESQFEAIVFGSDSPSCPTCRGKRLEKLLSTFAVSTGSPSRGNAPLSGFSGMGDAPGGCGSCGDPRGPGSCQSN